MKKYSVLFLFVLTMLTSCKKFLEQPAYNNVSVDDIFKDFEGARTTLVGLYDKMKTANYYQGDFYYYPDLVGGNIKYSRTNAQRLLASYNFTRDELNENDLRGFYEGAYGILYGANNVLANVDRAADATPLQKARMRAEAYAIRALVHFDLVRTFAQPYGFTADASHPGIVLRTSNLSVLTPTPQRASVKQVYDKVISDLDSAVLLYGQSVSIYPTGNPKTFLSANAALALKSRVALYRDDWPTVISLTSSLISANTYPLVSTSQYVSSWSGRNISSEAIFELFVPVSGASSGLASLYNPANTLSVQYATSNDLLNLYQTGDIRGRNTMFVSGGGTGGPFYYTRKYQGMADTVNNIRIIRASELYLNRAEAYAKSGNLTLALADLNTIRKRANPAATNFASTDQQVVIDEILAERRRELAFEGHLFFDIARNKKDLVRVDNTASIKSFTYPSPLYAYPIPVFQ